MAACHWKVFALDVGDANMRGKVKSIYFCMMLCACLGLTTACSTQEKAPKQDIPVQASPEEISAGAAVWMKGDVVKPPYTTGTQNWTRIETWEPVLPEPDFEYVKLERNDYAILGSDLYALATYFVKGDGGSEDGRLRQLLYWLDGNTKECKMVKPFWEEEGILLKVSSLEAVADKKLAVWGTLSSDEGSKPSRILWDLSAGTGIVTDVSAVNAAKQELLAVQEQWSDAEGNIFLVGYECGADKKTCNRLYIFSDKNKPGQAEILRTIDSDNGIALYCRLYDGTPLVLLEEKAVFFDVGTGEQKELASLHSGREDDGITDVNGVMFSRNPSGDVLRWDPVSGAYDKLLNLNNYGVKTDNLSSLLMGINQAGQLMVLRRNRETPAILVFAPVKEGELAEGLLSLSNLWYHDGSVKGAVIRYSSLHPECAVDYFTGWEEDSDAFYDRTMMEVVSGKGSDILYVHGEDMERLYRKGALADLTGILDEDTCEQLFSGVLASGTRDGKLIGLPAGVGSGVYLTVKNTWDKDSWTYEEAISLWRQYKEAGAICFDAGNHTRESLLGSFLLTNIADSPFLDLENGCCNFNSELFCQALELIGGCQCSSVSGSSMTIDEIIARPYEIADQIRKGTYLVEYGFGDDVSSRIDLRERYGEEICFPGFPSDSGEGNVLQCRGYLVINANTEHFEEAADFLRYYYGKEFQSEKENMNCNLRRDVLRERYEVQESGIYDKCVEGSYDLKGAYGESLIEDAIAYLDNCGPEPAAVSDIQVIIEEEAAAYFQGTQDLNNAARNIQNRVQLYLDENR